MTREELKARAVQAVEDAKDELIAIGRKLQSMPEPGYREVKTSGFLAEQLRKCGLAVEQGLALTGLRAKAEGRQADAPEAGEKRINIAVMGEMDVISIGSSKVSGVMEVAATSLPTINLICPGTDSSGTFT